MPACWLFSVKQADLIASPPKRTATSSSGYALQLQLSERLVPNSANNRISGFFTLGGGGQKNGLKANIRCRLLCCPFRELTRAVQEPGEATKTKAKRSLNEINPQFW